MKKHLIYLSAVALATGLAACANDDLEGNSYASQDPFDLSATLEGEADASTRATIDSSSYKIAWAEGDNIGIFYSGDEKAAVADKMVWNTTKGKYVKASDVTYPKEFNYNYAFYPYEYRVEDNEFSLGTFLMQLPGFQVESEGSEDAEYAAESEEGGETSTDALIEWKRGEFTMPMAGAISATKSIAFKNLTAMLKLTVKNVPTTYSQGYAVLKSEGEAPLAGYATVDVNDNDNYTLTITEDKKNAIVYQLPEITETTDMTFYFVVPTGSYPRGLHFFLDKETPNTDTMLDLYTKPLVAQRNYVYYKELILNSEGALLSDKNVEINKELAKGEVSVEYDLSDETVAPVIIIPKVYDENTTVTINLKDLPSGLNDKNITIQEGEGTKSAPKTVKIIGNVESSSNSSGTIKLAIDKLPNSDVELGDGTNEYTFNTVAATVGTGNIVYVDAKTTVTKLTISGGDIYAKEGAVLTSTTFKNGNAAVDGVTKGQYVFYDKKADVNTNDVNNITFAPKFIYDIQTAEDGETINVTESFDSKAANIKVKGIKNLTINLKGNTLSGTATVLALDEGATVKITDTDKASVDNTGTITSTSTSVAAVTIAGGSTLEQAGGLIGGDQLGVSATGAGSKFTLTSGELKAGTSYDVIKLDDSAVAEINAGEVSQGTVTLTGASSATIKVGLPAQAITVTSSTFEFDNADAAIAGALTVTGENSSATIKAKSTSTLTATSGSNLALNAGKAGAVTVTGATFTLAAGAETGAITATSSATVNINGGKVGGLSVTNSDATVGKEGSSDEPEITAAITVGEKANLTINSGKISAEADVITNASTSADGATININGGTITTETASTSALKIEGASTVNVKGGTITGVASAIDLVKGTLNVTEGEPKFYGENTIKAGTSATSVKLDAAGANYESTTNKYAVLDEATSGSIKSISGGKFTGDIKSNGKNFITGGYFRRCENLEKNTQYFDTFYALEEVKLETEIYWHVSFHGTYSTDK